MTTTLHPHQFDDPAQRELVKTAGMTEDLACDALARFATALYEEAILVKLMTPNQADLIVRACLVRLGEEMAHDWSYEEDALA